MNLSFDHAVFDSPGSGDLQAVSPTTHVVSFTAAMSSNGRFTIDPSAFRAPTYDFSNPVSGGTPATGTATFTLKDPATGSFNDNTGAVTINADFLLDIQVSGGGSCTIDTGPVTLSTSTTKPLPGQVFPANASGFATGAGAFGVAWSTLPAGTGPACAMVDKYFDGPGGIWASRKVIPPAGAVTTPPKLSALVAAPGSIKAGKTKTIVVTFTNTGNASPAPVKLCLAARKPLSPKSQCVTFKPAGGSTRRIAFKVRTTKTTKLGTHLLTLTATGMKSQTIKLKVTSATAKVTKK